MSTFPPFVRRALAAAVVASALAACSSTPEQSYVERPAEDLYAAAMAELQNENPEKAVEYFEEVERQHPYSPLATKAQLMAAYARYENLQYERALSALDRFIQLHPGSEDLPYAYYLRALSYYEQIADVRRDQRNTDLAMAALTDVVRRYPDTDYARDAKLKIDLARDALAGKEMDVGRFYMRRNEPQAAINRFRTVIEKYQSTTHAAEALHRLTEAYLMLGLVDEARAAAAVLGHNYPGSDWYGYSYALLEDRNYSPQADEDSWIGKAFDSVFW